VHCIGNQPEKCASTNIIDAVTFGERLLQGGDSTLLLPVQSKKSNILTAAAATSAATAAAALQLMCGAGYFPRSLEVSACTCVVL
jgi:hypothetical protein